MKGLAALLLVIFAAASCSENKSAPAGISADTVTKAALVPGQVIVPDTSLPADTPVVNGDLSP